MKRYGTKLYIIADINNPNYFVSIYAKKRSFTKGKSEHIYEVGFTYTLFTEYEKKKFFNIGLNKEHFKVVKIF
jgi:hypothetical protein